MLSSEEMIYSDEEVAQLPSISRKHPFYAKWKTRQHSTSRLIKQVQLNRYPLNILEVGCYNGWLAAKLANVTSGNVTGINCNTKELLQARRIFGTVTNLEFIATNILHASLRDKKFDFIVFASSIQFFPSLEDVIKNTMGHLTLKGQIHILDSPLYPANEFLKSHQDNINYYIHHLSDLEAFQHKIIYDPGAWNNKLFAKRDPCYHIVIKNPYH